MTNAPPALAPFTTGQRVEVTIRWTEGFGPKQRTCSCVRLGVVGSNAGDTSDDSPESVVVDVPGVILRRYPLADVRDAMKETR